MNSSLFPAIAALLAAQSPADLDRALPRACEAAAQEHADAQAVVFAVAQAVRERLRLSAEIAELSRVDEETGLPNRRAFDERLDLELRRSARSRKSFALALVVLAGGDAIAAAHAIGSQVRQVDFAARIGANRFAVLLVDLDRSAAQVIWGRISGSLAQAQIQASTGVTLSFPVDTAETLIERADAAVYDARFGG